MKLGKKDINEKLCIYFQIIWLVYITFSNIPLENCAFWKSISKVILEYEVIKGKI